MDNLTIGGISPEIRGTNNLIKGVDKAIKSVVVESPKNNDSSNSFASVITEAIEGVNQTQVESNVAIENMLTGNSRNIHETMVAMEKADVTLKLMVAVKNKALDAYNTIMGMQA